MKRLNILNNPTPYLFFTGKGGVGKTSLSCATAIALADQGLRVLLVSTDPASNLDEMLGVTLGDTPTPIPNIPALSAMNIDPDAAANQYRERVIDQLEPGTGDGEKTTVREQLSGACTTEIAAFDEFVGLLSGNMGDYNHVIFDTAPTGHTLRLLSLPKAWTGFLENNERGASCLGPHSGLKMQEEKFRGALRSLSDPKLTTVILVTRPDKGAVREAGRTSDELDALGLSNQLLAINGAFQSAQTRDAIAVALMKEQADTLAAMPASLTKLKRDDFPLLGFDIVGLQALRALFSPPITIQPSSQVLTETLPDLPKLAQLVDEIAQRDKGLIMVMGKGGVGKTTVAAAIAIGLVKRGHSVHLTTTDPAAHLSFVVDGSMDGLTIDRIDPAIETDRYISKIMETRGRDLDEQGKALLREDLASPCTEEVAVFHAFSKVVSEARSSFVVMDTAPTGHTLLLLDATGAYHRQMTRHLEPHGGRVITPLMRLQDPDYTRVILVALPETTPVSEAGALQDDLRRASIEPYGWVINKSMLATDTSDPLLRSRRKSEVAQIKRVCADFAKRAYLLGYQSIPPVGLEQLSSLS